MARTFTAASSQYLSRSSAVLAAAPLTLACWFRPSNVAGGTSKSVMSIDDGTASNFFLLRSNASTGTVSAVTSGGGGASASSTTGAQSNGVWGHCGAVFAAANSRVAYLNGAAATEETTSRTPVGLANTSIGQVAGVQFADGDIGEAAIWKTALTAFDMYRLAQGYSPAKVQPGYLVAYWKLAGGGSPEPDNHLGRFPLVVTNGPPVSAFHPPIFHLPESTGRQRRGRR